ncbi:hypothetical protein [Nitrospirillum sp. BR 11163]|uniref:hypothetical protein n=1 Tax=Nitrospirillum sp. BR 11163 TaxID=3104323 RepID=UPI002AFE7B68|nr:hypothetical protein [Nitrospirillum sp. BR 11163]MEA1674549.1 hypothetical protein [Nitrospirillum sp. BR 11163]
MTDSLNVIGIFFPMPGVFGFQVPVFSVPGSNSMCIQNINSADIVVSWRDFASENIEFEFIGISMRADVGGSGIYAIKCPDGKLYVGKKETLRNVISSNLDEGVFRDFPVLRFQISSFFCLKERLSIDARDAYTWLARSASDSVANSWVLETAITPIVRLYVEAYLDSKQNNGLPRIAELIRVRMSNNSITIYSDNVRGDCIFYDKISDVLKHINGNSVEILGEIQNIWAISAIVVEEIGHDYSDSPDSNETIDLVLMEAKDFLSREYFEKIRNTRNIPRRAKAKAAAIHSWINEMKRIGDIIVYMDKKNSPINKRQLQLDFDSSFQSIEAVAAQFVEKYGKYRKYKWTIEDFKIGEKYSSHLISTFSEVYSNRHGGIYAIGKNRAYSAVIIKATVGIYFDHKNELSSAKYKNEWVERGVRIKYYLKIMKINDGYIKYSKDNHLLLGSSDIPIHVFARDEMKSEYTYYGVFRKIGEFEDHSKGVFLIKT